MRLLFQTALSFPVALFSVPLGLGLIHWLSAALALLNKGNIMGQNADVFFATNDLIPGRLAKLLLKPELRNVPINLVLSALVFFGWMICVVFDLSILRFFPLEYLRYPLDLLIAGLALILAPLPSAFLCRFLRNRSAAKKTHRDSTFK